MPGVVAEDTSRSYLPVRQAGEVQIVSAHSQAEEEGVGVRQKNGPVGPVRVGTFDGVSATVRPEQLASCRRSE